MTIFTRNTSSGRDLVATGAVGEVDREEMRGWMQTLRQEASALRNQADHMNRVAEDAEALAERIESVLRAS